MGNNHSNAKNSNNHKRLEGVHSEVDGLYEPEELQSVRKLFAKLSGDESQLPIEALRKYFDDHLTGTLKDAFVLYFEKVDHMIECRSGVATSTSTHVTLRAFTSAIYHLSRGTSESRSTIIMAYESCIRNLPDHGNAPRQFLTELATAALAFYDLTGTRMQEQPPNLQDIHVSSRFVDFLIDRLKRKLRASTKVPQSFEDSLSSLGLGSDANTPNISSESIGNLETEIRLSDIGRGLSEATYISLLWELLVEHLFYEPFQHLDKHRNSFSGSKFKPEASTEQSSKQVLEAQMALANSLNEELLALRAQGYCRPRYLKGQRSELMSREDMWVLDVTMAIPMRDIAWRELYTSQQQGKSWTLFSGSITNKGATLIVVKDTNGFVFGGFATAPWIPRPEFYGDSNCFLFTLQPKLQIFTASGLNDHYQYFNHSTHSLTNGLAMGGQEDYWGFYLSDNLEDGVSHANPTSTTFESKQLSSCEKFKVAQVEAWLVKPHELTESDGVAPDPHRSVLDKNPDSIAMLEMYGKPMYSQHVRDPDVYTED